METNAAKPVREQLTLIRIFEELRGRGYGGGYDAVRRYARRWSKERGQSTAAAYVPLSFAPASGELANAQAVAFTYFRQDENEARHAKVLMAEPPGGKRLA